MKRLVLVCAAALVMGCSGKFLLIDRTDGRIHAGSTDGSTMGASGNATLIIDGDTYSGPWIYQANGGSFSFANFAGTTALAGSAMTTVSTGRTANTTLSGTATSSGSASALSVSAVGNGMVNARAESGKFIRCVFTFNTMQNTGIGECLRNDGRAYDLNVKR